MTGSEGLPPGLLLGFYGDDFTGSTDVMEVLTFAGLPTILFLREPTASDLTRFGDYRAVGIAGTARAQTPEWMDENLPRVFQSLTALDPQMVHYKICSTFDSAPHVGSIGRALEIGLRETKARYAPILVAAPQLKRYQMFGTLFAEAEGVGVRLDRHPTMARHPVTPMAEADLRRHLAEQTDLKTRLVDFLSLSMPESELEKALTGGARAIFYDAFDHETIALAGAAIWNDRKRGSFSVSSSGLQYALVEHWRRQGWLQPTMPSQRLPEAEQVFVLSGSCAPATAAQIDWAEAQGWTCLRADSFDTTAGNEVVEASLNGLSAGANVVVYTARGPDDPMIANQDADRIGAFLGAVARAVLERTRLKRLVVAGGDTSGAVMGALDVTALTASAPAAPGSPLCTAWGAAPFAEGLTLALKGGQRGAPDFFEVCRKGGS